MTEKNGWQKMVPHARVIEPELCGVLSKDNRHRIERVLRLRAGDSFVITDGQGREARAVLESDGAYSAEKWNIPGREPSLEVTLFAGISKGERLEWLIEKAVEMGVHRIVPMICSRCIVKSPGDNKIARWQKVAETAMIQCGGCLLPEVTSPVDLKELPEPPKGVTPLLLHEETEKSSAIGVNNILGGNKKLWMASGPEGGFSDEEVHFLNDKGWQLVWLGRRLFKTDTAPTAALAAILAPYWYSDGE